MSIVVAPGMKDPDGMPHVVVLLAACNGAAFLREQMESILQQCGVTVEVICSMDRSTDATEELLQHYARADNRVRVLPIHEPFGAAAPNFFRLLRDADFGHCDAVAYADQDDIWMPDKLQHAYSCLVVEQAQGYSSNCEAFWPDGRARLINKAQPQRAWDHFFEAAGPGCTYVISRELAKQLQQLARAKPDRLVGVDFHDWFTYAYARHHGFRWVIDGAITVRYRQHGSNQLGANVGWRRRLARLSVICEGYGHEQAVRVARAVGSDNHDVVISGIQGGPKGYLWLARHCRNCRRRRIDQLAFAMVHGLLALTALLDRTVR